MNDVEATDLPPDTSPAQNKIRPFVAFVICA